MGFWECVDEHLDDCLHANLRYDDVASSGLPARPLEFPAPTVYPCETVSIRARDHRSGTIHDLNNVIMRWEPDSERQADTAYLAKKKIAKSIYGAVWCCVVLKRRCVDVENKEQPKESREDCVGYDENSFEVYWESTDQLAAVKSSEWSKVHALRGRHLEDPIKEISALQHIGNYHPNVMGVLEVLQDDTNLYTVMQYLPNGDLYEKLLGEENHQEVLSQSELSEISVDESLSCNEEQARIWFGQLLKAIFHLQKKGVCHRDISLENLLLDEDDQLVLVDPGLSLRVPYTDPCNIGCVTDASAGTCRRLVKGQGQGGKLMYAAPEVIDRNEAFDGFAVDMWSAGVILFVMLVGKAPFKWAHRSDKRYAIIAKGGLKKLIANLSISLSDDACDLLQGLFWGNPRKRYTLAEVMRHPWVANQKSSPRELSSVPSTIVSTRPKRFMFSNNHHQKKSSPTKKSKQTCGDVRQRTRYQPEMSHASPIEFQY